ncbi:alpha-hydroxy-acid oxidizing protein, partial [Streptomyces sp. BH034]|uniref:alpha-hydroxy-acid oxidizing protein n=1 Tax=Streptomyces sp. BH034 TaxID=3402626 RepID=UPI003BB7F5AC
DAAKALALGATAVGVGRPYAYALAAGGTDGVVAQLRALLAELDLLMAIDGFPTLADLRAAGTVRYGPELLRANGTPRSSHGPGEVLMTTQQLPSFREVLGHFASGGDRGDRHP